MNKDRVLQVVAVIVIFFMGVVAYFQVYGCDFNIPYVIGVGASLAFLGGVIVYQVMKNG